jgi:hypothetical protein
VIQPEQQTLGEAGVECRAYFYEIDTSSTDTNNNNNQVEKKRKDVGEEERIEHETMEEEKENLFCWR